MPNYELLTFLGPLPLAQAAAEAWLSKIESASRQHHSQLVALSGGRIAGDFFRAVAENARRRSISSAAVQFFWGDERCVPPQDPESNYGLAEKWLLQPLQVSAAQVHRIRGELPPEEAASEAAAELRRLAPANPDGQPVLDLIFLGMGEDGHIASLFPATPPESIPPDAVYWPVTAVKPPPKRITLTYPAIIAAREVWVLASGAGKTEALRASLAGTQTPLGRLLSMRPQTRIFTDSGNILPTPQR